MTRGRLGDYAAQMDDLIRLSGEINLVVAGANAGDEVRRMNLLSLWLTLVIAFEGFVSRAYRELCCSEQELEKRKAASKGDPDVVLRLQILRDERGLDLGLPGEPGDEVVKRHFLLRNKWAHNLGLVERRDRSLEGITCWAGQGEPAWPTEAGWSELRCAVENLKNSILALSP